MHTAEIQSDMWQNMNWFSVDGVMESGDDSFLALASWTEGAGFVGGG